MTKPALGVVVMGISGAGKTTVGALLAQALGATFLDADDLHPAENVAKLRRGEPLTDADRWPWLARVRGELAGAAARAESVVIACSALKERYRAELSGSVDQRAPRFVFLTGSRELLWARLSARTDHFMPASLFDSQLATLEPPPADEALQLDVAEPPEVLVQRICAWLCPAAG
jgi:gluconokinase